MRTRPLLLLTASGLAREVLALLRTRCDRTLRGFLDDDTALHGTSVDGLPVLGGLDTVITHPDAGLVVCAGSGHTRSAIVHRLSQHGINDAHYATVIDPSVRVPAGCSVGSGSIVLAQTVLTTDVAIGRFVVAMPHVVLTHDDRVDDFATLCAGVALGGHVHVGSRAFLGMNSSVRQGVRISDDSTLGMGSTLLTDLPAGETWAGVPAHVLTAAEEVRVG